MDTDNVQFYDKYCLNFETFKLCLYSLFCQNVIMYIFLYRFTNIFSYFLHFPFSDHKISEIQMIDENLEEKTESKI